MVVSTHGAGGLTAALAKRGRPTTRLAHGGGFAREAAHADELAAAIRQAVVPLAYLGERTHPEGRELMDAMLNARPRSSASSAGCEGDRAGRQPPGVLVPTRFRRRWCAAA